MFSILASVVEQTCKTGGILKVSRTPLVSIAPFVFTFLILGLIFSYFFYKKRLEHKQIMAAIEKGIPLSELRPTRLTGPRWIKIFTTGIALLLISLPFLYMFLEPLIRRGYTNKEGLFPFGILFALGVAFFIRGLLLRKAQKKLAANDQL